MGPADSRQEHAEPPAAAEPPVRPGPRPELPRPLVGAADSDLEGAVTRVYLAAVQHPRPTRALLIAQGIAADLVDRSLAVLAGQGLVTLRPFGAFEVVPPDVALPALAADFERRARSTRSAAPELAQVYFHARSRQAPPDPANLRVLGSLDEIAAATAEIVSSATARVRSFRALTPRTRALFEAPVRSHEQPSIGAGGAVLEMTGVYDRQVLGLDGALRVLEARERGRERVRLAGTVPFSAVVVDDTAAVLDLSGQDPSGAGSLVVRSRPLVRALAELADLLWDLGTPLTRSPSTRTAQQRDQAVLALLAAGASDATIARQVGVSQRTVERRVRTLMDQVGAGTRFQAGVQAARRGLI